MLSITVESLENQDISIHKKTEFLFEGVTFTKKMVVPKKFKKDAIDFIEEYATDHLKAILIEHKLFFSVWLEEEAIRKITNAIKPLTQPDVIADKLDEVDTSENVITVSDKFENANDSIEEGQKPIDLLSDSKMREERFELEDLLSSQLKEFGI